ncbi:MAG: tyrosine-type recombinase/integrase [Paludibacteraceae bacterium]|nr:tyrosine-type recombinase/integrase [Paludibacteraceae bacterium]
MGKKSKITVISEWPEGQKRTTKTDKLVKILKYKYPERADVIIERFEAYTALPFTWDSIKAINIQLFKDGCYTDLSPNSAATTCAWLSSVIRLYGESYGENVSKICEMLTLRRERGKFAFVDERDIEQIIAYYRNEKDITKRAVAAMAIVEFYTGARKSDTTSLSDSNIERRDYIDKSTGEQKSVEMIVYTSKKTKINASIPVKPIVKEILSDESIKHARITTQMIDFHIKGICKSAGMSRIITEHRAGKDHSRELYKCVSSHTFRRSFATNLDRKGVNIETTSRMMGHTNTEQTRRYVCGDTLVIDKDGMEFFN